MKKVLSILVVIVLFGIPTIGQIPTNGLVGWWSFNGNANDLSGFGNIGTIHGASLTADRFGISNSAYHCPHSCYIEVPNFQVNYPEMSISGWFKTNEGARILQHDFNGSNGTFLVHQPGINAMQGMFCLPGNSSHITMFCNVTVNNNLWHHVVISKSSSSTSAKMYIDGILKANYTTPFTLNNGIASLFFGNGETQYNMFLGDVDDIRIYNRELSQSEVTALFNESSSYSITTESIPSNGGNTAGSGIFQTGIQVTVNATAYSGFNFSNWTEDGEVVSTSSTFSFMVSGNKSLIANFTPTQTFQPFGQLIKKFKIKPSNPMGNVCVNESYLFFGNYRNNVSDTIYIYSIATGNLVGSQNVIASGSSGGYGIKATHTRIYLGSDQYTLKSYDISNILNWTPVQTISGLDRGFLRSMMSNDSTILAWGGHWAGTYQFFDISTGSLVEKCKVNTNGNNYNADHYQNSVYIENGYSGDVKVDISDFSSCTVSPFGGTCGGCPHITNTGFIVYGPRTSSCNPQRIEIYNQSNVMTGILSGDNFSPALCLPDNYVLVNNFAINKQILYNIYDGTFNHPMDTVFNNTLGGYLFSDNYIFRFVNDTCEVYTRFGNGLQASNIVFSDIFTNQLKINWTDGNGTKRAVFIKQDSVGTASPVNNTTYTANTTFGSGSQIGTTGWFCVFNGTTHPTGITVTNLLPKTNYRVMVCEYSGNPGAEQYLTSTATNNPKTQKTASYIIDRYYSFYVFRSSLEDFPGNKLYPNNWYYMVVTRSVNTLIWNLYINGVLKNSVPAENAPYNLNSLSIGYNNWGGPNSYYKGIMDELRVSSIVRTASEISANYNSNQELTVDANTAGLWHFNESSGTSVLNSASSVNGTLYNGVSFVNGRFSNALSFDGINDFGNLNFNPPDPEFTNEFWIKFDTVMPTNQCLLYPSGSYVWDHTLRSHYDTILQASNIVFSNVLNNQFSMNWTDGNGTSRAVFIKQDTTGTASPVDKTTYTANTVFGSGSQIGSSGWYCVFNGSSHAAGITVTGLQPGTKYRAMVCDFKGAAGAEKYITIPETGNPRNINTCSASVASVNIAASANPVCAGTSVTFTATPTNGGTTPAYQWRKSGTNITGATNATYTYLPTNGDVITCQLTSNTNCVSGNPATSNAITMTVTSPVPASVMIFATASLVCQGETVMFLANPVNGGASPTLQWKVNGSNVGANSQFFSYVPVHGDIVTCTLTSGLACVTGSPANSNTITMTVKPQPVPSLSGPGSLCLNSANIVYTTESFMTNYIWSVTGGAITAGGGPEDNTVTVTWTEPGNQQVMVNYTNTDGCSAINPMQYTVNVSAVAAPGLPGPISGPSTISAGQSGVVYSVAPITDATGYVWQVPPGATITQGSNTNSIIVNFSASATSGIVNVFGTNSCGNGPTTQGLYVNVGNNIPVGLSIYNLTLGNGVITCYNATQNIIVAGTGNTFRVLPGGEVTMIAGKKISYLPGTTVYSGGTMHGYITTSGNYCLNPFIPMVTATQTSEGELQAAIDEHAILVYPNPTDGMVIIDLTAIKSGMPAVIRCYSLTGAGVLEHETNTGRKHEISLSGHSRGLYLLHITIPGKTMMAKIVLD